MKDTTSRVRWIVILAAFMLLAACSAPPPRSSSPALNSPLMQTPMSESEASNQPAARAAVAALAKQLIIETSGIHVVSAEEVEWPDGCLGVAKPNQMCTQVIVPGYRVMLEVNGTQYEVRTDKEVKQVEVVPK